MTNREAIEVLTNKYVDLETSHPDADYWKKLNPAKELAIKALEAERWIPVSERLPNSIEIKKDNGEFVVQSNTGKRFSCRFGSFPDEYDNPLWCCNVQIIAWRPLPEEYKE